MSLAILFHFLCAQHVSDINIRVAGTSCASACNTDITPTQPHRNSNKHRTKNNTTNVVIQHNSPSLQAEAQVVLQPATQISLQPNHTETPTNIEPRTIRPMW